MRPFVVILAIAAIACGSTQGPPRPRHPAAPLQLVESAPDLDGAIVGPSDDVTIVVSFASWCVHCQVELDVIAAVRERHPRVRVLGVNYKAHEEYGNRGSSAAVRAYVAASAPWLRVVPIGDTVFRAFGSPPKVPTMYVFDRSGAHVETYDRRERSMPDAAELDALLRRLGT